MTQVVFDFKAELTGTGNRSEYVLMYSVCRYGHRGAEGPASVVVDEIRTRGEAIAATHPWTLTLRRSKGTAVHRADPGRVLGRVSNDT